MSKFSGYLKLGLCILFIWLLLWFFTPLWVAYSPIHQKFAELQDHYNIPIGALYYNDLPFLADTAIEYNDRFKFYSKNQE